MSKTHFEEKATLPDRARSLGVLAFFTIAIAIIATIAMDLLILPISLFAVENTKTFSIIIKWATLAAIIGICLYFLVRRIVQLQRGGFSVTETVLYLLRRLGHYTGLALIFLIISGVIITFIYFMLSSNDLTIHKITGS